jgi:hypothetical protein
MGLPRFLLAAMSVCLGGGSVLVPLWLTGSWDRGSLAAVLSACGFILAALLASAALSPLRLDRVTVLQKLLFSAHTRSRVSRL